jgi:hypothetical protein
MLQKLANTTARRLLRHRFSQARYEEAINRFVAAYVDWREESAAARDAYSRFANDTRADGSPRLCRLLCRLDREERAAAELAACVEQVRPFGSPQAQLLVIAAAGAGCALSQPRGPKESL